MSIEWIGYRVVRFDEIEFPKDVGGAGESLAARKKAGDVAALAESMDPGKGSAGPINAPVVRAGSKIEGKKYRLVAGLDRIAALSVAGKDRVEVRIMKGEDDEVRRVTLHENLTRRRSDEYDTMASELVALEEKRLVAEQEEARIEAEKLGADKLARANAVAGKGGEAKGKRGRPTSVKGEARRRVAKHLGTSPEAIRQATKRHADSKKPPKAPKAPDVQLETWGLNPGATDKVLRADEKAAKVMLDVAGVQRVIDSAESAVKGILKSFRDLKGMGLLGNATLARVASLADALLQGLVFASPDAFCLVCKDPMGFHDRRASCTACGGTGFLAKASLAGVDKALKAPVPNAVIPNGDVALTEITETGAIADPEDKNIAF